VPWDLAESQRIAGKCWPKVGGCYANQASSCGLDVELIPSFLHPPSAL
jgi:hypothetical protein